MYTEDDTELLFYFNHKYKKHITNYKTKSDKNAVYTYFNLNFLEYL